MKALNGKTLDSLKVGDVVQVMNPATGEYVECVFDMYLWTDCAKGFFTTTDSRTELYAELSRKANYPVYSDYIKHVRGKHNTAAMALPEMEALLNSGEYTIA